MCYRLILDGSTYICGDCWTELLVFKQTWPDEMKLSEVRDMIEAFMDSKPGTNIIANQKAIDEEFERLTGGMED